MLYYGKEMNKCLNKVRMYNGNIKYKVNLLVQL